MEVCHYGTGIVFMVSEKRYQTGSLRTFWSDSDIFIDNS